MRKVCRHLDCVWRVAACWKRRANGARHAEETDMFVRCVAVQSRLRLRINGSSHQIKDLINQIWRRRLSDLMMSRMYFYKYM